MANDTFKRSPNRGKFAYFGIDCNHPLDSQPPNRAPFLLNVSPNIQQSTLQSRPGSDLIATVDSTKPIHSLIRVNDLVPEAVQPYARFVGADNKLFAGQAGAFTEVDSGYSGNPLSLVPYRPPMSPETWLYVFDSIRQRKLKTDGTLRNLGIAAPAQPPISNLANTPLYTALVDADATSSGWTASGDAGTPASSARVTASTTVQAILYDSGTTGWCLIAPTNGAANFSWLGLGMRVRLNGAEDVTVEQIFPQFAATTITAASYDAGATGMCTVVLDVSIPGMVRNALLLINGAYYRVLSVTVGPDDKYSIRLNSGGVTLAGAMSVMPVAAFRAYTVGAYTAGESITSNEITSAFTFSSGQGLLSQPVSLDLSKIGSIGLTGEDYLHISLWCDTPVNLTELHILLDVDAAVNDFTRNYYYYVSRQGDFTSLAQGGVSYLTSQAQAVSNLILDSLSSTEEETSTGSSPYPAASPNEYSTPSAEQIAAGAGVWFELTIKLTNMTRVGNDQTVDLSSVKAIGVLALVTGNLNLAFGSWWVGGGYGPDANFNSYGNQGIPIQYRYRYRSLETGAISDVSPATRNGEIPRRQGVALSIPSSTDVQVDVIDIERFGGTLSGWKEIATVTNGVGNVAYTDSITEAQAEGSQALDLQQYQPFPVTDKPRSGMCNIVGTSIHWVSGDQFNQSWIRGVEIIVNNQTYTLRQPPNTAEFLETAENIGVLVGVAFSIPEATIAGVCLPYAWESKGNNRLLACGDLYNPGWLYFTNNNNADSASDQGYIEVTSPSEPLIGGLHFEGADYCFTAHDVYKVLPSGDSNVFASFKLSLTYGLAGPWAFAPSGPYIFLVSTDGGIYKYNPSGASERLTGDLYSLFPHESSVGVEYQPIPSLSGVFAPLFPPNFGLTQYLRLAYVNNQLFFDYVDSTSTWHTFVYDMGSKAWVPYFYNPQIVCRYQEQGIENPATLLGAADGRLLEVSQIGTTYDAGTAIVCVAVTPSDDQNDARSLKEYGDYMVDYQGTIEVNGYYDNFVDLAVTGNFSSSVREQRLLDTGNEPGAENASWHQSTGMVFVWTADAQVILYEWAPSWIPKPDLTAMRPTDWTDCGYKGLKWIQGRHVHANTFNQTRTVLVEYDGGKQGASLPVLHPTEQILPYSWTPFQAYLVRLRPTDAFGWSLFEDGDWVFVPMPDATGFWSAPPTSFGLKGYISFRDCQFAYSGGPGALTIAMDGAGAPGPLLYSVPLPATTAGLIELKQYLVLPPLKGKLASISAVGTNIAVFEEDTWFGVKEWGSTGPYAQARIVGNGGPASAKI